jgi:HEAT repeat protein
MKEIGLLKLCHTSLFMLGIIGTLLLSTRVKQVWGNGFAYHGIPTEVLLAGLRHPQPENRAEAARILGMRHEKIAVEPLIALLQDEQERDIVKHAVLDALSHIKDQQALQPILKALQHDESAEIRASAARALGQFSGLRAMNGLIDALQTDRKIIVQIEVIRALGHVRHERVETVLIDLLTSNPNAMLQTATVDTLGQLQSQRATMPLITLLRQTPSSMMRREVTKALGRVRDPKAVPSLMAIIEQSDNDPILQGMAITALGQIGDRRAVQPLVQILDADNPVLSLHTIEALGLLGDRDASPSLTTRLQAQLKTAALLPIQPIHKTFTDHLRLLHEQTALVHALGKLQDPRSVDGLYEALTGREFPRDSAEGLRLRASLYQRRRTTMVVLSKLKPDRIVDLFVSLLQDPDETICAEAARLLGDLHDVRAGAPLIAALADTAVEVRLEAAGALGKLQASQAVSPLIVRLQDPSVLVRERTVQALAELRDKRAIAPLMALRAINTDARVEQALAVALAKMDTWQ